jgi:caa(3)-type oxidase subunit IV
MNEHGHAASGDAPDVHELDHHLKDYKKIITVLAVATGIEFGIAWLMTSGRLGVVAGIVVLVAIAFFKAVLVAKFFMHLKYDPKPLAFVAITPLILATPLNIICCFDQCTEPTELYETM